MRAYVEYVFVYVGVYVGVWATAKHTRVFEYACSIRCEDYFHKPTISPHTPFLVLLLTFPNFVLLFPLNLP